MKLLKIVWLITAIFAAPSSWAATKYAAPTTAGAANGNDCANAYLISSFWSTAAPGDTLKLCDGTYTGASSMILPTSGLNGASGNPITISAVNDGAVTIDGQEARNPCYLQDNDWLVIEGIDCANSSGSGVLIEIDSDDNIFRRVGCIEAGPAPGQRHCWYVRGDRNLIEDTFAIGRFNKGYTNISSDNVTVRRAFCMFREGTDVGPKMCYSNVYNSRGGVYENVIGMWNQLAGATDQRYGIFSQDRLDNSPWESNSKYLGGIGVLRSADSASSWAWGMQSGVQSIDNVEIKDMVLYNEPSSHTNLRAIYASPFVGSGAITCATTADGVCDRDITNVTEVGWTTADNINTGTDGWTVTNKVDYASIAAMNAASANPFQSSTGTGARVCYRYNNGTLTTTPLWPWPMNQRIIDAMTTAGYTAVDVTATMESIFGTIPSQCRSGGGVSNLGLPFNGVSPTLGAFDPPRFGSAVTVDSTHTDFTFINNVAPPIANVDHTKCTITEGGTNRAVSAGAVVGSNVMRLTHAALSPSTALVGTCAYGAVTDSSLVGNSLNQPSLGFTQSITNTLGGGGVAYTMRQSTAQIYGLPLVNGVLDPRPQGLPISNRSKVVIGGAGITAVQVVCEGANCPAVGVKAQGSWDGTNWWDMPDSFDSNNAKFYGTSDTNQALPAQGFVINFALDQTYQPIPGFLRRNSSAVPTFQLNNGQAILLADMIQLDSDVTPGDILRVRYVLQDGTLFNGTPNIYAELEVVDYSASGM